LASGNPGKPLSIIPVAQAFQPVQKTAYSQEILNKMDKNLRRRNDIPAGAQARGRQNRTLYPLT
jgi:hypothetical protein